MRWSEAALFLSPFLLYAAWRLAAARASPSLVWGAVGAVALLAAVTIWMGLIRRMPPGSTYVPAQEVDGRIVAGHAAGPPPP